MFLRKTRADDCVPKLRVELTEDDSYESNLTLLFEESKFGRKWSNSVPAYDSVKNFRKHLLSMSCLTLKGFRKMTSKHSVHLVPEKETVKWLRGLLKSICATDNKKNNQSQEEDLYETLRVLGCSSAKIFVEETPGESSKERIGGRHLAKELCKIGTNESLFILSTTASKVTKLTSDFRGVMLIERRRLEEDEEYFPSSNPVRHVMNFKEAPAELETIIIQAAFPGKGAAHLPCWGNALIPIIIEWIGNQTSPQKLTFLKKTLVIVISDILQVIHALESLQMLKKLVGNDPDNLVTERTRKDLLLKVGVFIDGLVPLLTYCVLCDLTSSKTIINREKVLALLVKGRRTNRVLIKNFKQKLRNVCQCVIPIRNVEEEEAARKSIEESSNKAERTMYEYDFGEVIEEEETELITMSCIDETINEAGTDTNSTELSTRRGLEESTVTADVGTGSKINIGELVKKGGVQNEMLINENRSKNGESSEGSEKEIIEISDDESTPVVSETQANSNDIDRAVELEEVSSAVVVEETPVFRIIEVKHGTETKSLDSTNEVADDNESKLSFAGSLEWFIEREVGPKASRPVVGEMTMLAEQLKDLCLSDSIENEDPQELERSTQSTDSQSRSEVSNLSLRCSSIHVEDLELPITSDNTSLNPSVTNISGEMCSAEDKNKITEDAPKKSKLNEVGTGTNDPKGTSDVLESLKRIGKEIQSVNQIQEGLLSSTKLLDPKQNQGTRSKAPGNLFNNISNIVAPIAYEEHHVEGADKSFFIDDSVDESIGNSTVTDVEKKRVKVLQKKGIYLLRLLN